VWAKQTLDRLLTGQATELDRLWAHPERLMIDAGMTPDPWQLRLLCSSNDRLLVLTHRQAGKSWSTAAVALHTALLQPKSLTLLLSPSERQSGELALKVWDLFEAVGRPLKVTKWTALQLHLENGSRIIALPGEEKTIRGYSGAALLVVDEAARVPDALYFSVRPMLGVSKGRMIALSTPFGKRGFFYGEWTSQRRWERFLIPADQCPRLSRDFLKEERAAMGERWYRQEYCCSFEECIGAVFTAADFSRALDPEAKVLPLAGAFAKTRGG
jgi:hypothetical protein